MGVFGDILMKHSQTISQGKWRRREKASPRYVVERIATVFHHH